VSLCLTPSFRVLSGLWTRVPLAPRHDDGEDTEEEGIAETTTCLNGPQKAV